LTYRHLAKSSLERAKIELNSNNDDRIKYAALELRMTLESIIFEIAKLYKEELTSLEFNQWQPKKLLQTLLNIDPSAGKSEGFSMGEQEAFGKPAKKMTDLGVDRRLTLKEVKKYYDKLGNFLHTNTLEQIEAGKYAPPAKMKQRCSEVISILDEVLESPIYSTRIKKTTKIKCFKCNKKIIRCIPDRIANIDAKCVDCSTEYFIKIDNEGVCTWTPQVTNVSCANLKCSSSDKLFNVDIKEGNRWSCSDCGEKNQFYLNVALVPKQS